MALIDGLKIVAAAGTAEPLSATSTVCDWVIVTAFEDNTSATAMVGASTVKYSVTTTARGVPAMEIAGTKQCRIDGPVNLTEIYIDVGTNGDGVYYAARTTNAFGG